MNEIEINSQYTVEDYIRTETFLKNSKKLNFAIINFGSLFIFACGLFNLFIAFEAFKNGEYDKAYITFCLFALVAFGTYKIVSYFVPSLYLRSFRKKIKKHYDPDSIAYLEREIIFTEEGIQETNSSGKYLTYWKTISKVVETEEDFYFYLSVSVRFQPKREISEDQTDLLRILIKANLQDEAEFQCLSAN
jgi:YcxB-like protein